MERAEGHVVYRARPLGGLMLHVSVVSVMVEVESESAFLLFVLFSM
jgi:hypothetical protein